MYIYSCIVSPIKRDLHCTCLFFFLNLKKNNTYASHNIILIINKLLIVIRFATTNHFYLSDHVINEIFLYKYKRGFAK
jgi:hypothetical protein